MKTIVDLVEEQKEYLLEKDTAAKQAVEANIAPVEADPSSASRAYVVGEQLFLNDVLYDVTSPISVGDAIAVGTNITAANKLSSDIKSKIDDLYLKDQAFMKQITVNGAVNELDHTGVTDTSGTVKFTVNEDKSITVSANSYPVTLDSTTTFFFFGTNSTAVPNIFKGKKFVGCPSGGASGTYRIAIQEFSSTTPSGAVAESSDVGEGANISNGDYIRMYIRLGSGYQLTSALTFKPMISLPELGLSYDDYVPYAKTNQELTAENQTLTNQVKDMNNVLGAKNLLPISLKYLKSINTNGTWNDNTYTVDGVTYTVNTDSQGSIVNITTSGTASTNSALNIYGTDTSYGENNFSGMILNGCPSGGGTAGTDYRIVAFIGNSQDGTGHITINDTGDGATLTNASYLRIYLRVPNGYSSSLVFKPMIRLASITDDTYEPYAKTNKELTEDVANAIMDVVIGDSDTRSLSDFITDTSNIGKIIVAKQSLKISTTNTNTLKEALGFGTLSASIEIQYNDIYCIVVRVMTRSGFAIGRINYNNTIFHFTKIDNGLDSGTPSISHIQIDFNAIV